MLLALAGQQRRKWRAISGGEERQRTLKGRDLAGEVGDLLLAVISVRRHRLVLFI
jgi:hypothetical protein